ncbi:MAG TPA: hypothetical protein DCY20_05825, partial [Firmicutes bacterium]|nr:hypothetical protein [Bacillota bacterium]
MNELNDSIKQISDYLLKLEMDSCVSIREITVQYGALSEYLTILSQLQLKMTEVFYQLKTSVNLLNILSTEEFLNQICTPLKQKNLQSGDAYFYNLLEQKITQTSLMLTEDKEQTLVTLTTLEKDLLMKLQTRIQAVGKIRDWLN